jgi:hypothetical protein
MAYLDIQRSTIIQRLSRREHYASAGEVLEALNKKGFADAKEVAEALVGEQILFAETGGAYSTRSGFFKDASVLIRPTSFELERGILIPGHRFIPLYDLAIPVPDLKIRTDGRSPKKITLTIPYQELSIYFQLFGAQKFIPILIMEDEGNGSVIARGEEFVHSFFTIQAFNMEEQYRRWDITEGSYLKATLTDWSRGSFVIEALTAAERKGHNEERWVNRLEEGFLDLWKERSWPMPPDEELSRAFHRAGRDLLDTPPLHLGGFFEKSGQVKMIPLGNRSYIWDTDRDWDEQSIAMAGRIPGLLAESRLEDLLDRNHLVIPLPFARACIRNTVNGNLDYQTFLSTILAGNDLEQLDEGAWKSLLQEIERLYKEQKAAVRLERKDRKLQKVRKEAIFHYTGLAEILRELEHQADPEEVEEALLLENLAARVLSIVPIFDFLEDLGRSGEPIPRDTWPQVEQMLQDIVDQCRSIVSRIDDGVMEGVISARKERRVETGKAQSYYILEAVIDGTEPPIRRLLRVPDTMNLADLHRVLQTAFGWEHRHLHEFQIDGECYFNPDDDPERAAEDDGRSEHLFTLADLARTKQFGYLYDFGDGWQHTITILKIFEAGEISPHKRESPVCLMAERSAPPEDCGGILSFDDLLLARATPPSWLSEEQRAALAASIHWQPDNVDIEEINRLLEEV